MFNHDPFSLKATRDPLPIYKVLRDKHPVYFSDKYNVFFFTRCEDILKLLSHAQVTIRHSISTPAYFPAFRVWKHRRFQRLCHFRWRDSRSCK